MPVLLDNPYFEVDHDPARKIVVMTRRSAPFPSIEEADARYIELTATVSALPRPQLGLLIDIRNGPLRNDPQYETILNRHREAFTAEFARVAVLVQTSLGAMQARRHARSSTTERYQVFRDEAEARRHAEGG